jgi:hypothetical protein
MEHKISVRTPALDLTNPLQELTSVFLYSAPQKITSGAVTKVSAIF